MKFFFPHFKSLVQCSIYVPSDCKYDSANAKPVYKEFKKKDISREENYEGLKKPKFNKSCSEDYILNELFMKCQDTVAHWHWKLL